MRVWVCAAVACLALAACKKEQAVREVVPEVLVAPVVAQDVPIIVEAVGQTRGSEEVEIRPRVQGYLQSMHFQEGQPVKRGDLLYVIDPRPFEAALAEARGRLAQAEADLTKAHNDVARFRPLVERRAISQQELDNAIAAEQASAAAVEAARGAVQEAQVSLSYTRITSPTDGLVGISAVSVGNLVGPGGQVALTSVSKVDPIRVRVAIPEREYLQLARGAAERRQAGDTAAKRPIDLVLADGSVHPHPGQLRAVEARTDPTTGTISVEIEFPNPERILRAGQFARVRSVMEVRAGALVIPARAVQEMQGLQRVAVVKDDNTVEMRTVKTGPHTGNLVVVEEGLSAGERVVVEGMQRVRSGIVVSPKPLPAGPDSAAAAARGAAAPGGAQKTRNP